MKPSDFFIGVIEFFSVMLPGALLTYFLMGIYYKDVFGEGKVFAEPQSEAARWIVFLLITYIVGNIVFMLAAFLDPIYDRFLRKRIFQSNYDLTYITANAVHCKHVDTDRKLSELVAEEKITKDDYRKIYDNLKKKVEKWKDSPGSKPDDKFLAASRKPKIEIFNTYKWSQHFLAFKNADALAEIKRIEADSKFFRSLVLAFFIIAGVLLAQAKIAAGGLFILLAALCFYRYGDFRRKATAKAYEMIITCYHLAPAAETEAEKEQTASAAELKQDLTEDFSNRHREMIAYLTKGFNNPLKQIIFSDNSNQTFVSGTNEAWCCLRGRGGLIVDNGSALSQTRLMPNAIIPVTKGSRFSFVKNSEEPIEILVLES